MIRYIKSFFITAVAFAFVIYGVSLLLKQKATPVKKKEPKVVHIRAVKVVQKDMKKDMQKEIPKQIKEKIYKKEIAQRTIAKRTIAKKEIVKKVSEKKSIAKVKSVKKDINKKKNKKIKVVKKQDKKPRKKRSKVKKRAIVKKIVKKRVRVKRAGKQKANKRAKRPIAHKTNRVKKDTRAYISKPSPAVKENFLARVRAKIKANIQYPPSAKASHTEGRVEVMFNITPSGYVSNIRFIKAKRVFRASIKKAFRRAFPVNIPPRLKTLVPFNDIYLPFDFSIE